MAWSVSRSVARAFRVRRHDLVRKPDAGKPHVRFDERGSGNAVMGGGLRPGAKAGGPAPDSTKKAAGGLVSLTTTPTETPAHPQCRTSLYRYSILSHARVWAFLKWVDSAEAAASREGCPCCGHASSGRHPCSVNARWSTTRSPTDRLTAPCQMRLVRTFPIMNWTLAVTTGCRRQRKPAGRRLIFCSGALRGAPKRPLGLAQSLPQHLMSRSRRSRAS